MSDEYFGLHYSTENRQAERGCGMTRIKLGLLYHESNLVFVLSKLFANIAFKFMDRHHKIYLKYFKLTKEVEE